MSEPIIAANTPQKPRELNGWQTWVLSPLAWMVRGLVASLKFDFDDELVAKLNAEQGAVVFALWHNRSFISHRLHRIGRGKSRQLWGMVSASKDGAWLSAFYRKIGVNCIRGSSSRRSMQAAREMARKAREGHDLGITVDGPRGPVYQAQSGAAWLMLASGAKLFLVVPEFTGYWRMKSWDKYYLPKPFSTVKVHGEFWQPTGTDIDRETLRQEIEKRLRALTVGTDRELNI